MNGGETLHGNRAMAAPAAAAAELVAELVADLARITTRPWTLMEVCGGQTHAIVRWGLDQLLPPGMRLLHGPGCPVCVTAASTIDAALQLARQPEVILCSYGDMLRVPGSAAAGGEDLLGVRAAGGDVRLLTSPLQALDLQPPLASDCAPLWPLVEQLLAQGVRLHALRDLTRGGLASALQELSTAAGFELLLEESAIPVLESVARCCELLGFEPLHLANEGRCLLVVPAADRQAALKLLEPLGGAWIGAVGQPGQRVLLRTAFGSERLLVPLSGELLPRIC